MEKVSRLFNIVQKKRVVTRNKTLYFNLDYSTLIITKTSFNGSENGRRRKEYDAACFTKLERFSVGVEQRQASVLRSFYNDVNSTHTLTELEQYHKLFRAEEVLRYRHKSMTNLLKYSGLDPTEEDSQSSNGPFRYGAAAGSVAKKDKGVNSMPEAHSTGLRVTFQPLGCNIKQVVWFFETCYDRECFISLLLAAATNGGALTRRFRALNQEENLGSLTIEQAAALFYDLGLTSDDIYNGKMIIPRPVEVIQRSASISLETNPALAYLSKQGLLGPRSPPPPPSSKKPLPPPPLLPASHGIAALNNHHADWFQDNGNDPDHHQLTHHTDWFQDNDSDDDHHPLTHHPLAPPPPPPIAPHPHAVPPPIARLPSSPPGFPHSSPPSLPPSSPTARPPTSPTSPTSPLPPLNNTNNPPFTTNPLNPKPVVPLLQVPLAAPAGPGPGANSQQRANRPPMIPPPVNPLTNHHVPPTTTPLTNHHVPPVPTSPPPAPSLKSNRPAAFATLHTPSQPPNYPPPKPSNTAPTAPHSPHYSQPPNYPTPTPKPLTTASIPAQFIAPNRPMPTPSGAPLPFVITSSSDNNISTSMPASKPNFTQLSGSISNPPTHAAPVHPASTAPPTYAAPVPPTSIVTPMSPMSPTSPPIPPTTNSSLSFAEQNSIVNRITTIRPVETHNPELPFPHEDIPQNIKRQVFHHTLLREFLIYLRTQMFYVAFFNASQQENNTLGQFQQDYKLSKGKFEQHRVLDTAGTSGISNSKVFIVPANTTPVTSTMSLTIPEDEEMSPQSNAVIQGCASPSIPLEFSLESIFLIYADIIRLISTLRNTKINGIVITSARNTGGNAVDTAIKVATLQHYLSTHESIFENKFIASLGKKGYEDYDEDFLLQSTRDRCGTQAPTNSALPDSPTSKLSNRSKQAKQLYVLAKYQRLLSSYSPKIKLLIGEDLYFSSQCGVEIPVFSSNSAQGFQPHLNLQPAKLCLTNYRIIIIPHDPLFDKIDIPNFAVLRFGYMTSSTMGKGSAAYPFDITLIDIDTKELQRKLRIYVDGVGITPILELAKKHCFSDNTHDAFAFKYKLGLISAQNSFTLQLNNLANGVDSLSPQERKNYNQLVNSPINPDSPGFVEGWNIFDAETEYRRQGLPLSPKQFSYVQNKNFLISPTYPALLVVPSGSVNHIYEICEHRSRGRYPMVVYYHKLTNSTISRCSQPLVGLAGKVSPYDVQLLTEIRKANISNDRVLHIFDCRPYAAAIGNKIGGKGMEKMSHYEQTKLTYLGIDNIHAMSASYKALHDICSPTWINQSEINNFAENCNNTYLNKIVDSKWLHYIGLILSSTSKIVQTITEEKCSVVIHCSDGWDRTAQLSSLTQMMLDPYFRSLEGFIILISKEFVALGHQFQIRVGHGEMSVSTQRSPIFIQFLDCVYQILHQYPKIFEFNADLLVHIAESLYSCRYGTFLFNSENERNKFELHKTTVSLWTEILNPSNRHMYLNPSYSPTKMDHISYPDSTGARLVLFDKLHLRYAPHMKTMVEEMPDHPGSFGFHRISTQ